MQHCAQLFLFSCCACVWCQLVRDSPQHVASSHRFTALSLSCFPVVIHSLARSDTAAGVLTFVLDILDRYDSGAGIKATSSYAFLGVDAAAKVLHIPLVMEATEVLSHLISVDAGANSVLLPARSCRPDVRCHRVSAHFLID